MSTDSDNLSAGTAALADAADADTHPVVDPAVAKAQARALAASLAAPIDQSLQRGNPRQRHNGPSVWDHPEPLMVPAMVLLPGNITAHEAYSEQTAGYVAAAVDAMTTLHATVKAVIEAREVVKLDASMTPSAQALAVDALQSKLMTEATKKADSASRALSRTIAAEEAALAAPIVQGAHSPLAAEIRSHVKNLESGARLQLIQAAIAAGDWITVGAVLGGAPSFLSGLDSKTVEVLCAHANRARNPQAARKLELMRHAQDKLDTAGSLFIGSLEAAAGVRSVTVAKLRAQQQKTRTVIGAVA